MGWIWLAVAVLAAVVEALVPSLVSVWFVPAAVAALLLSLLGWPWWLQLLVFLAVSLACLAVTRPLAKSLLRHHRERTNADRAVGATGIVIQDIDNVMATGRVTVLGNSWAARTTLPSGKVEAGTKVRVEAIEGVKLLVTPEPPPSKGESENA